MSDYIWVGSEGVTKRSAKDGLSRAVGQKAIGLLALPPAWTPPFLVVSSCFFTEYSEAAPKSRSTVIQRWIPRLNNGIDQASLSDDKQIIVRSNACDETLRERGLLNSIVSTKASLKGNLTKLFESMLNRSSGKDIALILQEYVVPLVQGHLSNERRVREDARDGLIELEDVVSGEISRKSIGHRRWRRKSPPTEQALICGSMSEIKNVLREPLVLAASLKQRINFEWVWNGSVIYVVQADKDHDTQAGKKPESLVGEPAKEPGIQDLQLFRIAKEADKGKTSKLDNHLRFQDAGFWQPTFFVLDDADTLREILSGTVSPGLKKDLKVLTQTFFMIRSACISKRVVLLPRSHLLTSAEEASEWLIETFATKINKLEIDGDDVVLIAHHYIQAVASAFSMGSVDNQDVRIEASWGIPEGLYYNPCDTYIVNTFTREVEDIDDDFSRFTHRTPSRGPKRHFVAPNPNTGQFERHEVAIPFDWRPTIGDQGTLNMIAAYTRRLAADLDMPINLMWFIDCRTSDGDQKAIPWYSERLEEHSVETYMRNAKDTVYEVSTEAQLVRLEKSGLQGLKEYENGRLVVELNPTENAALRDTEFAERVGAAVKECGGIIVLNGATLSHIYYILQRSGATVFSMRPTEVEAERESHHKLVRDKIPDVVRSSGERAVTSTLSKAERQVALRIKLIEEAFEVKDATKSELLGELADVIEVVRALCRSFDISPEQVEAERVKKEQKRGSFDEGIVLLETLSSDSSNLGVVPHSQAELANSHTGNRLRKKVDLDSVGHGWRDIRQDRDFWEVIESATLPLWHNEWSVDSRGSYSLPESIIGSKISWEVLGKREGPTLKIKIIIRFGDRQLSLDLPTDE